MELRERKKPAIDIDGDRIANRNGIFLAVVVGVISFAATLLGASFLWFGIIHWNEMSFQRFGGWLLSLLFTLLLAAQTIMCFSAVTTGISNIVKRSRWLKQAIRSQVKIVDRREEHNDYAESREEVWECSLAVSRPPSTAGAPPGQVEWISVSSRIYDRYRNQDVAPILYDLSYPEVFIFEGE